MLKYIAKTFKYKTILIMVLTINIIIALFWATKFNLYQKITVEALEAKNIDSIGSEVWIQGIEVDGYRQKEYKISSGKWIWKGEMIGWRNYNQPDNTTQQIVFELPAGMKYEILFESNEYRGLVNISLGDTTMTVDCYSPSGAQDSTITQQLYPQSMNLFISQMLVRALLSIVIFLVLILIETKALTMELFQKINWKESIWYIAVPLAVVGVVIFTADYTLWGDEMLQLSIVYNKASVKDIFESSVNMVDATPPLFSLFAWLWVKLVPYGEQWLRLLPTIIAAATIVMSGKLAKYLWGELVGKCALICTAFSSTLAVFASHQFRAYALYALLTVTTIFAFFTKSKEGRCGYFFYGVSMALLLYCHYYGALVCGILFLWDLYMVRQNKQSLWKMIRSYLLAGLAFVPWVIIVLFNLSQRPKFWAPHPTLWSLIELLYYICSNNQILVFLLIIAMCMITISVMRQINGLRLENDVLKYAVLGSILAGMPLIAYIADVILGGDTGIFGTRYFINLIPVAMILIAKEIGDAVAYLSKRLEPSAYFKATIMTIVVISFILFSTEVKYNLIYQDQTYQQAIREIMSGNDIYADDTAIVIGSWDPENRHLSFQDAVEYYVTMKGQRDSVPIYDSYELDQIKMQDLSTVYVINLPGSLATELTDVLNTQYIQENNSTLGFSKYIRQ